MPESRSEAESRRSQDTPVADYKRLLQSYIDRRPSGMRLKIAEALGKHKSFVSQITNPAYAVPVPARHLETIFRICHFSREERDSFMAAYSVAHPGRTRRVKELPEDTPASSEATRTLELELPVLDDPDRQREMEDLIRDFARRLSALATRS